jgi:hypothetical protein
MAATGIERPRYYERQFLGVRDFEAEQEYHRDMRRRHNLAHHTWGIVTGLDMVQGADEAGRITVTLQPGMAVDGFGREILVLAPVPLEPLRFAGRPTGLREVWIRYREERAADPAPGYELCDVPEQQTRLSEGFEILVDPQGDPHDAVVVDGHEAAPLPPDEAVPHQELPRYGDADRWHVRIGSVNWTAAGGGAFVKPAVRNELRTYVGLVGDRVLAPAGRLRIRDRLTISTLDVSRDTQFAAVEGSLRVDGRLTALDSVELDGGRLAFRDAQGGEKPALEIYREDDEGLRVRIGDESQGKRTLRVGIKDGTDFAPQFVVDDRGQVQLNTRLTIRTADRLDAPPVRLERADGLHIVIGDRADGSNRLAVGPVLNGAFTARLTVADDGTTAITGNTTIGAGGLARLRVRLIEGKHWQNDSVDDLYLQYDTGKGVLVGKQGGKRSSLIVTGDAVVGSMADGVVQTRHVRGKQVGNDNLDALYLNWATGQPVEIGTPGGAKSDLRISGNAVVGSGGDAVLATRHIRGKSNVSDAPDDLYVNWGTGTRTVMAGDAIVGAGANGTLHVRHVDGKDFQSDNPDALHLNYGNGKDVVVGSPAASGDLIVNGDVVIGDPAANTDKLSIERFTAGVDKTDLRLVIGDNRGSDDRLVVGPRFFADQQFYECFVVTDAGDAFIENNLTVGGARTYLKKLDGAGNHWVMVGGTAEGPDNALGFSVVGNTKQVFVQSPWTKNFRMDHPLDADNRHLVHATLEGPEVGVYYRGEARLTDGRAEVDLPAYFEALTRDDGRTVQVTPRVEDDGAACALAATDVRDGRFAVRALDDRNASQSFYWEVKAVRADVAELDAEPAKMKEEP